MADFPDVPEDADSENSIGTDMSSSDWGGDDDRDFAEEAANERVIMAEHEETDEPYLDPVEADRQNLQAIADREAREAREALAPPKGRLFLVYTERDDTVLRAAINAEDDDKAVEYFRVWRNQGIRAQVLASAPSPR